MINIRTSLPTKKNKLRKRKTYKPPSCEIHQLIHEVLNQLTVMNLCCFKFRMAAAELLRPSVLADIDRIESAVIEITTLLEKLSQAKTPTTAECTQPEPNSHNVYPLFKPTHLRG